MPALFLFCFKETMPNYCDWHIVFSKLSEKNARKLRDCINKNKFCETVSPQSKEVLADKRLEHKYYKAEKEYKERNWIYPSADDYKKLREKYPFKQLWYDWNCHNWGTKWGMCDASMTKLGRNSAGEYQFTVDFWTARSPLSIDVLEKCSKKFDCDIYYEYSEPWMWFSWIQEYSKWELTLDNYRDDPYYWEVRVCLGCDHSYGDTNEEDWYDWHHFICYNCWTRLVNEYAQHVNKIKKIVRSVNSTLNEDTYRTKIINKIIKEFSIEQFEVAEFIYDAYEDWLLYSNGS